MADGVGEVPSAAAPGGAVRRYVRFSGDLGAAICARLAAGESLARVCRDDGMPNTVSVYGWARKHPAFGAAFQAAKRQARVAQRLADRARAAARWGADGDADGRCGVLRDGRGRWSQYTPELGETICWRIANGESLKSIGLDPQMPSSATVLYWVRRYPDFADAYAQARQMMAESLSDMALEIALGATPGAVWADKLRVDTIRWMAARQAPRKYCEALQTQAELEEIRAEAAEARGGKGFTVIVKRFTDVTPEEQAAAEAYERL